MNNRHRIGLFTTLLAGMLFGLGLGLSEMTNPQRVLGFLDVAGDWDPVLLAVMIGALVITTPGFQWFTRRGRPLLSDKLQLPTARRIDLKLIAGACLFGIGWGLAGLCPGPAIVSLVTMNPDALVFAVSMLAGMWVFKRTQQ